jgi:GNAT superfamily N-acetyltransferase
MSYICNGDGADRISKLIKELYHTAIMDFRIEFNRSPFAIKFWYLVNDRTEARFTLIQQPNCCGILVSTDTYVNVNYRGKGIGQEMLLLKEALAKEFGYSLILATVNMSDNPAECHILEKNGWIVNTSFINARTNHKVGIFSKVL